MVLGARNLGGAIARHLRGEGWDVTAVARSADALAPLAEAGIATERADASDADALAALFARTGPVDLAVNAVSASRPPSDGPFGGGPVDALTPDALAGWSSAVGEQAGVFLAAALAATEERRGTIVQVTGGSSRRANPGRGAWSAGAAAVRALTHAAAQEHRAAGAHVALLIVDGVIRSPKTAGMTQGASPHDLVEQEDVARAVAYLASQSPHALTHELVLTPAGDRWLP